MEKQRKENFISLRVSSSLFLPMFNFYSIFASCMPSTVNFFSSPNDGNRLVEIDIQGAIEIRSTKRLLAAQSSRIGGHIFIRSTFVNFAS